MKIYNKLTQILKKMKIYYKINLVKVLKTQNKQMKKGKVKELKVQQTSIQIHLQNKIKKKLQKPKKLLNLINTAYKTH